MSTLPADVEVRIDEYVKRGGYSSPAEVLHAAMDALEDQRKLAEFRRKNEIALEQSRRGEYGPLDKEAMLKRLQKRLEAEGK